jgi:PST family polysaccharide transporter
VDEDMSPPPDEVREGAARTVKASAITLAGQWTRFVIQTGSLIILARLLSPRDYGLVAMVTAIVGIAQVLGDFGLSLAAVQARVLSRAQKSNLFWLNSLLGLTLTLVVFLLRGPIASFYHRPQLTEIVSALSVAFVINGLTTQFEAELTRSMRFSRLAIRDVAAAIVAFAVALGMAVAGAGYWALVGQQLALAGASLLGSVVLSGWWPGLPRIRESMGGLLGFGANTMGLQVSAYVASNIDSVFVGRFWGAALLGVYNRAYTLFTLPLQQLTAPLTRVVLPTLSRIHDDALFVRYLVRAQLLNSYILVGTLVVGAAVAQPLIETTLGPQWSGVVPIFQVLALGGVFSALGYLYYWIFLARDLTGVALRYGLFGRAAMVLFLFIGAHFSVVGAAWGATAGSALLWFLYTAFAVPRAGLRVGSITVDTIRVLVLYAIGFAVTQEVLRSSPDIGPAPVELLIGLALMGACLVAGVALVPAVRRDVRQIVDTVRLLRARQTSDAGAPGTPPQDGAPPQNGLPPEERDSSQDSAPSEVTAAGLEASVPGDMRRRALWEEIADASLALSGRERSLAVDVQRRGGDAVP